MVKSGITILGTGGDTTVIGKHLRAAGGILIRTPAAQFHIDPGPGALIQLAQFNIHPKETSAILLSHHHTNHANDAEALIASLTDNGKIKQGKIITNNTDQLPIQSFHLSNVQHIKLEPSKSTKVNDTSIVATETTHYDAEGIGYLLHTPNYIIGYTGDTAYSEKIVDQYKDANILIVNCKYPDHHIIGHHLNTHKTIELINKVKPDLAIITHFSRMMLAKDPLLQARKIQQYTGVQTIAATDGMYVAPASYSAKRKQKSLESY